MLEKISPRLPTISQSGRWIESLFTLLFLSGSSVARSQEAREQLRTELVELGSRVSRSKKQIAGVHGAMRSLGSLRQMLVRDATFIAANDPAARSLDEIYFAYPGFFAIAVHRFSHLLASHGVAFLPRLFSEYAHRVTGVDIHPGARIGVPFMIDHGTGIVIGETSVIGRRVKLFQGVTLGGLSVRKKAQGRKRHPTLKDDVTVYANATILGGNTVIGQRTTIGGNVWLVESVPPRSIVHNLSSIEIKVNKIK